MISTVISKLESVSTISLVVLPFMAVIFSTRLLNFGWDRAVPALPAITGGMSLIAAAKQFGAPQVTYVYDFSPYLAHSITANWSFTFDTTALTMIAVVAWVSCAVQFFACFYMAADPYYVKFVSILMLFTGCMFVFVSADNLLVSICGWESLGLCSFALIGFWTTRLAAIKAALKAIAVNRVGDTALVGALIVSFIAFQSWTFSDLNALAPYGGVFSEVFAVLVVVAALAKSAQLGFHVWLSDAMEGPTPVSALLHAATMVTAGVFLVIRLGGAIEASPVAKGICFLFGSGTALFAAIFAFFQYDLKKTIAFSTSSQIGFMFTACGASAYNVALLHLFTHAFFKALLFVCAGCAIHAFSGEQDLRRMGGLFRAQPFLFGCMFLGSAALAGFPFLAGFYSKDLILAVTALGGTAGFVGFVVLFLAACLTATYSANTLFLVFFGYRRSTLVDILAHGHLGRVTPLAVISLLMLTVPSVFAGYFLKNSLFVFWLEEPGVAATGASSLSSSAAELLPVGYKLCTLVPAVVFLSVLEFQRMGFTFKVPVRWGRQVWQLFQNRAYFENLLYWFIVRPTADAIFVGFFLSTERLLLEGLVVEVPVQATRTLSYWLELATGDRGRAYLISFLFGAICTASWLLIAV